MPVRITWCKGKDAAKAAVVGDITASIVKDGGNGPQSSRVISEDVKPSDWANAGKLYGQPQGEWLTAGGYKPGVNP